MLGTEYRWFVLHPLIRGAALSVALAGLCLAALFFAAVPADTPEPANATVASETSVRDQRAAWPRTVLRLWFLAPQLLPPYDR